MKWLLTAILLHLLVAACFWQGDRGLRYPIAWVSPLEEPLTASASPPQAVAAAKGEGVGEGVVGSAPLASAEKVVRLGSLREALSEGNVEPHYPIEAVRKGWQGVAKVRLEFIDGAIFDVTLEESSGHTPLDREAVKSARRWRFNWVLASGRTVVYVPVEFELIDEK